VLKRAARGLVRLVRRDRLLVYSPHANDRADPGEIVWAWVAFEDRPEAGKDRPVLVVGREGRTVLGLYLSSNAARDGRPGWLRLGPGPWDRRNRPSWIRMDRVLRMRDNEIRREGAALDRARFDYVAATLRAHYGWR
jgi:hypothetical protein